MTAKQYNLETLTNDYGRLVTSICRRMIQDEETARDAAQEVWIEVMKSLPSFKGESKPSTWLYTIAYRVVMKFAKKERRYSVQYLRDYFRDGEIDLPHYPGFEKQVWVKDLLIFFKPRKLFCPAKITGKSICSCHKSAVRVTNSIEKDSSM